MSLKATLWALDEAPVEDPTQVLLLIAMADWANDEGRGIWPSMARIAGRARVSERTAQRHLKALSEIGVIERDPNLTDPRYTAIAPRYRPSAWKLNLHLTRGDNLTPLDGRGDSAGASGVTAVSPNPSGNPAEPSPTEKAADLTVIDGGKSERQRAGKAEANLARQIVQSWWDTCEPKPVQPFPAITAVVKRCISAGWTPDAIRIALRKVREDGMAVSGATLEIALGKRQDAAKAKHGPFRNPTDPTAYDPSKF